MNLTGPHTGRSVVGDGAARARRIEAVLEGIDALPTLPAVASRLLSIATAREADLNEVIRLIESDPPQAARILRLCAAADKGLGSRVTTVRRAVLMLGLDAVRAAVLSVQVFDLLERARSEDESLARGAENVPPSTFDRTGFWRYCIGVGCAAELVAGRFKNLGAGPDEAYIAGLLSGVGKLALDLILPRAYGKVLALAERRREDSASVERAVLGIDHHAAGRRLAERWGLPAPLRDAIWLHGRPASSLPATPDAGLVAAVTLAQSLARALRVGWSGDFSPPLSLSALARAWSVPPSTLEDLAPSLFDEVAARVEALGLERTTSPALLTAAIVSANAELGTMAAEARSMARRSARQRAALDAVREFLATGPVESTRSVVEAIGRSAARAVEADLLAVACLDGPDLSGRLRRFDPRTGRGLDEVPLAGDGTGHDVRGVIARAALGIGDQAEPSRLRVEVLTPTDAEPGTPVVALAWSSASGEPPAEEVLALWGASLRWCWALERARRENDALAQASRQQALSQERLAEAESLARLGEFVSGAAQQFSGPLATIGRCCQALHERARGAEDAGTLSAIEQASEQISDLVATLYVLSNPAPGQHRVFEVGEAVSRALELARSRLGSDPRVEVEVAPDLPRAEQDPELLAIALAELVINAREADPTCQVRITAQSDPVDDRLVFRVIDRGPGLSPRARRHGFDAFFSEKPGRGVRGLGLTRARRMVQALGGTMTLEDAPGGGALGTIAVPRSVPPEHRRADEATPAPGGGPGSGG